MESLARELKQSSGKLTYFPFNSSISLFIDASWIEQNKCCGKGFALVNGDKTIILIGARNERANSSVQAEMNTLVEALRCCVDRKFEHLQ